MDLASIFSDAGTIAAIATGIVFAIQFLKNLYYKLPWGWAQKTPSEVWYAVSIVAGVGVALALNFSVLSDSGLPIGDRLGQVISGLTVGAGSKLIHAIATPAGAKFKKIKEDIVGQSAPTFTEDCATPVVPDFTEQLTVVTEQPTGVKMFKLVGVDSDKFFVEIGGKLLQVEQNVFYEKEDAE